MGGKSMGNFLAPALFMHYSDCEVFTQSGCCGLHISEWGFFQRPTQDIQGIAAILNQYVCSVSKMFQIVTLRLSYTQAGDAVAQIARGFKSVDGGFEKIGSAGVSVDVKSRPDAGNCLGADGIWTWFGSHLMGEALTRSRLNESGW